MATVGHLAAGAAIALLAGKVRDRLAFAVIIAAAAAPDVDFLLGIEHRGPTHSIGMVIAVGIVTYAGMSLHHYPDPGLLSVLVMAAATSHLGLDLLTAEAPLTLFWPVSTAEYALPATPLPIAPTDRSLFTVSGLVAAGMEATWACAVVLVARWWVRRNA